MQWGAFKVKYQVICKFWICFLALLVPTDTNYSWHLPPPIAFFITQSQRGFKRGGHYLQTPFTDTEIGAKRRMRIRKEMSFTSLMPCPLGNTSICFMGNQPQIFNQLSCSDFFCQCWHIYSTLLAHCLGITGRFSPT